jgi:hypothetical protein
VDNGYIITSVLNTSEQEVGITSSEMQVMILEDKENEEIARIGSAEQGGDRGDQSHSRTEVVERLRTDHLNEEERKSLLELCFTIKTYSSYPGIGKAPQTRSNILYCWSTELSR